MSRRITSALRGVTAIMAVDVASKTAHIFTDRSKHHQRCVVDFLARLQGSFSSRSAIVASLFRCRAWTFCKDVRNCLACNVWRPSRSRSAIRCSCRSIFRWLSAACASAATRRECKVARSVTGRFRRRLRALQHTPRPGASLRPGRRTIVPCSHLDIRRRRPEGLRCCRIRPRGSNPASRCRLPAIRRADASAFGSGIPWIHHMFEGAAAETAAGVVGLAKGGRAGTAWRRHPGARSST